MSRALEAGPMQTTCKLPRALAGPASPGASATRSSFCQTDLSKYLPNPSEPLLVVSPSPPTFANREGSRRPRLRSTRGHGSWSDAREGGRLTRGNSPRPERILLHQRREVSAPSHQRLMEASDRPPRRPRARSADRISQSNKGRVSPPIYGTAAARCRGKARRCGEERDPEPNLNRASSFVRPKPARRSRFHFLARGSPATVTF
ncbi:hypothetical protein SKAU_G00105860 [Synaphobranchus kaupii]|uniref:Uncharacterized protein n=1 Tax=Synaphobranchus kaupii TaxID=118154 RepID=A0A9Q1G090_SYNKA|nr:hypothetical protein SKAU_G00105860 [Synaphobranchus kaupii]